MNATADLYKGLAQRVGFQVVGETTGESQLRVIGRLPGNQGIQQWLLVINQMLKASESAGWKVDISKQYFRREGRVVYGWRLIFQGDNILGCLPEIVAAIASAPNPARQELTEMALVGASASRNDMSATGKGAGYADKTMVGPAAIARRMMGG